jgi:IMP dehydrogenase/GMP reductase
MRIENEILLDFSDVLIRPKRSTLTSRKEVSIERTFQFVHSKRNYSGVPIIAANMDTVGTFEMARALELQKCSVALHKFYDNQAIVDFFDEKFVPDRALRNQHWVSLGISEFDLQKLNDLTKIKFVDYLCVDVANGYQESFVDTIKSLRDEYPNATIMAGNVVTGDMTEALILAGADVVKVGIGPGCFTPESLVLTDKGLKPIVDVNVGDLVLTHKQNWQAVTNKFEYQENESLVEINGIKSTKTHEYYVLHKKYKEIVTDDNIHEYAEWISSEHLTSDYVLIKHKDFKKFIFGEISVLTKFELVEIIEVKQIPYSGKVYDLEVGGEAGDHSYNIEGVVVHNSGCTTRKMTGVGFPQLSAIIECADAAHGLKGLICADGGITSPGDVVKAFGAGADFVMMGGMFAAHDESGGELIVRDGKKYKQFYGMSSDTAQLKYYGEKRKYRASEGRTLELPYRGAVSQTLEEILGGLRSGMTYIGAKTLKEVSKRTTFVRVNRQLNDVFVK